MVVTQNMEHRTDPHLITWQNGTPVGNDRFLREVGRQPCQPHLLEQYSRQCAIAIAKHVWVNEKKPAKLRWAAMEEEKALITQRQENFSNELSRRADVAENMEDGNVGGEDSRRQLGPSELLTLEMLAGEVDALDSLPGWTLPIKKNQLALRMEAADRRRCGARHQPAQARARGRGHDPRRRSGGSGMGCQGDGVSGGVGGAASGGD